MVSKILLDVFIHDVTVNPSVFADDERTFDVVIAEDITPWLIEEGVDMKDVKCESHYDRGIVFAFKWREDAMMFKLRWG